jgi:4-hydroxy-tetrahydrodipicolinate reductase
MDIKVIVCGARGRMGQEVVSLIQEKRGWELIGAIESPEHPELGIEILKGLRITSNLREALQKDSVIIEFTNPSATLDHLQIARENRLAMVIGTTGFKSSQLKEIKEASRVVPILLSPNMSVGINLLFILAKEIAQILRNFDKEIIEVHHRLKQDAPSGTAYRIAQILAEVEGKDLSQIATFGRKGIKGERRREEIGIHSIRGGTIVGEHTVIFAGEDERLEITHRAESRKIFARGALMGARFIIQKDKGLYDLQDALGIKR